MEEAQRMDFSMVFSGEAGQGLQTLEQLMLKIFKNTGWQVYSYSEFMSRIRGGNNSTQIRISSKPSGSFRRRIDLFVPLHHTAFERFHDRITQQTLILGDNELIPARFIKGGYAVLDVPLTQMAKDAGGTITLNMVVLGTVAGVLEVAWELVQTQLEQSFSKGDSDRTRKAITAASKGYEAGTTLHAEHASLPGIERAETVENTVLMNGIDAIGLGALAGGCNFVSAYPMSPSTGVLVFFARQASSFGVVVEQAEDEISAINMALGAWYAGGRALVTTSGGGFALMVEALSLSGAIESPLIIHIGQRPGPATGLPTRTEQADLNFVLSAGHGEFPRVILTPGTIQEGFTVTRQAFDLADTYQIPVIILTDQTYLESNVLVGDLDISVTGSENHIVETDSAYLRYALTPDGISPRGIPGFGQGIVCVDSDEHDEGGYITEDLTMRTAMVKKRLGKLAGLKAAALSPTLHGPETYRYLIVGWGSTRAVVCEALEILGRGDIAFLHFSQVYPLPEQTAELLGRAAKRIIIENNATGQFARLIKQETGFDFDERIMKFDGLPFMLEDVIARLGMLA